LILICSETHEVYRNLKLYTQAKLPVKINLNCLQVWSVTKQLRQGTSGPKGQVEFWQNTIWEFDIFAFWVWEPPQVFIFPLLWTALALICSRAQCATNRVRGVAGIIFRMASRQTATIATSYSIWPHEILAFTTSAFPSFYSSHILAHLKVFIMLDYTPRTWTALCADAVMWYFRLVIFTSGFFLSWRRWGEGQIFLCRYLWRVMH